MCRIEVCPICAFVNCFCLCQLLCILTSLTEWESISKPADVSLDPTPLSWPTRAALLTALCQVRPEKHLDNWCGGVEDVRGVIECVWGQGMITLYMEGRSLELVGVARRMVGNARETISLVSYTIPAIDVTVQFVLCRYKRLPV